MCGIAALIARGGISSNYLLKILKRLQHRGYDGFGYTKARYGTLETVQRHGKIRVSGFKSEVDCNYAIAHTRYKTYGDVMHCQPIYNKKNSLALVHNGQIEPVGNVNMDSETILNILDSEIDAPGIGQIVKAVLKVFETVKGAYSCILMVRGFGLVAFRDLNGIRPLCYSDDGDGTFSIASESCALRGNIQEILPGEILIFGDELYRFRMLSTLQPCLFEYIYFASPKSIMNSISVQDARHAFGKRLGNRISPNWYIDMVIPVPESSCIAAQALAETSGIPYETILTVNKGRTFILPTQEQRESAVEAKFHVSKENSRKLKGCNVLVVDDSIVRGTTLRYVVQLLKDYGAVKVYLASVAPPVRHQNFYGIDLPSKEELIAYGKTNAEVAKALGANGLIYQDLGDMELELKELSATKINGFENSLFTGEYLF